MIKQTGSGQGPNSASLRKKSQNRANEKLNQAQHCDRLILETKSDAVPEAWRPCSLATQKSSTRYPFGTATTLAIGCNHVGPDKACLVHFKVSGHANRSRQDLTESEAHWHRMQTGEISLVFTSAHSQSRSLVIHACFVCIG